MSDEFERTIVKILDVQRKKAVQRIMDELGWDKQAVADIMSLVPISYEYASKIVGLLAEHRQRAYIQGAHNGFNVGFEAGYRKLQHDVKSKQDE